MVISKMKNDLARGAGEVDFWSRLEELWDKAR
jgi:hypothetical protein